MKKNNILLISMVCLALSLVGLAFAQEDVLINMKSSFTQGQYTSFSYTFTGFSGEVEYYSGIRCDELPVGFYIQKINVSSGNLTLQHEGFKVDRQYENCYAYVNVLSPASLSVNKPFIIENANLEFDFEPKACKDASCNEVAVVFLKGENIYLSYDSSIESPAINAILSMIKLLNFVAVLYF